jgi:hypothetical protein
MQSVFGAVGAAAGCGQPQPQRPHINEFLRTGSSAMPQSTQKKLKRCGIPRLLRTMLKEARAKGKFWCGQNLPFCSKKTQKIKRCQEAEKLQILYFILRIIQEFYELELGRHILNTKIIYYYFLFL